MNTLPSPVTLVPNSGYETTRFNALRHGVLSRHTVLPWEDRSEYESLLNALVVEHAPDGPTEEHLVEELAGIIWRKRRLRMAEAAVYRERQIEAGEETLDDVFMVGAQRIFARIDKLERRGGMRR